MPGVPFAMPSDTVIVLNKTLFAPAASAPALAWRASPSMCMLQGVTMFQVDAGRRLGDLGRALPWEEAMRPLTGTRLWRWRYGPATAEPRPNLRPDFGLKAEESAPSAAIPQPGSRVLSAAGLPS